MPPPIPPRPSPSPSSSAPGYSPSYPNQPPLPQAPPPIPHSTRPTATTSQFQSPPPYPPLPSHLPRPLSSNPSQKLKQRGPTLLYTHPSKFYSIRDELVKNGGPKKREGKIEPTWIRLLGSLCDKMMKECGGLDGFTVTKSTVWPPGGPNQFYSHAPGFTPEPDQVDDYKRRNPDWATSGPNGGEVDWMRVVDWSRKGGPNSIVKPGQKPIYEGMKQQAEVSQICEKAYILGLGYHFFGPFDQERSERYMKRLYELLRIFFADPATFMEPEIWYGQVVPGKQGNGKGRPEGFLHVRGLVMISQILPLLPSPPSPFSPHFFMHPWLERHVEFLQRSEIGVEGNKRKNNIKDFYLLVLCTHLVTLNRSLEASKIIRSHFFGRGLASRIDSNGVLVHEIVRPNPWHYTCFELEALVYLAELESSLQRLDQSDLSIGSGQSIWAAQNNALKRAFDFALRYFYRSLHPPENESARWGPLLPGTPKDPEDGAEVRDILWQARAISGIWGREGLEWLIGKSDGREMEEALEVQPNTFKSWSLRARWEWAMREGY